MYRRLDLSDLIETFKEESDFISIEDNRAAERGVIKPERVQSQLTISYSIDN